MRNVFISPILSFKINVNAKSLYDDLTNDRIKINFISFKPWNSYVSGLRPKVTTCIDDINGVHFEVEKRPKYNEPYHDVAQLYNKLNENEEGKAREVIVYWCCIWIVVTIKCGVTDNWILYTVTNDGVIRAMVRHAFALLRFM